MAVVIAYEKTVVHWNFSSCFPLFLLSTTLALDVIMFVVYLLLVLFPFVSALEGKNCKVDIGFGFRQDFFQWELAGPENKPPVLSRLTWRDLNMCEFVLDAKKITSQNLYFRINGDVGWIIHGKNRDSDFQIKKRSKRIEEYSRSDNDGGKGNVWDASFGMGLFLRGFWGKDCNFRWVPLVGYSYHRQNLNLFNGFQTIQLREPKKEGHHIHHLDSSYDATWHGPWVGADFYYHLNDCLTVVGAVEYHWLCFSAKGDWNLRNFTDDFHQHGHGQGVFGNFGVDYTFLNGWYIGAQFKGNYAWLRNGTDRVSFEVKIPKKHQPDKVVEVHAQNKLRSVKWHSFSILFTAGYNF